jgi:hypothetical protein
LFALFWKGGVKFMKWFKGDATYKSLGNSAITELMGKRGLSEEDAE